MATSPTPKPPSEGNDGSWFLRAVGFDAPPETLADVDADNTTQAIQQLWSQRDSDALEGWSPDQLSRTVERNRSFRWPVVVSVTLLIVAIGAGIAYLPRTSEQRADARATSYRMALGEVRGDLPDAQLVLAALTEPESDSSQFADLIPTVADLRADAGEALDLAGEPLPSPWPLAPQGPFEELRPYRDEVSMQATTAQAIARRLGDVLEYRSLFDQFMRVGELPTEAANLSELNTRLATVAADSAIIMGELPEDAALFDHRAEGQALLERFLDWQVDYVDALRNDDVATAEALRREYRSRRGNLNTLMLEALAAIRSEVDAQIIQLAGDIDATVSALSET